MTIDHPLLDPPFQCLIGPGVGGEPFASFMRKLEGRFEEEEAALGHPLGDSPSAPFLHDRGVVGLRVVGEDRELESVLSLGIRVTPGAAEVER
jgi:hypothetical protein